jgi:hypothetical protein
MAISDGIVHKQRIIGDSTQAGGRQRATIITKPTGVIIIVIAPLNLSRVVIGNAVV